MEISVYPEAFINNSSNIDISNSNKAILCRNILEKYKDILCDNKDGCIFKLSYIHPILEAYFESHISCLEFSAPDDTIFISNKIFDKMCLSIDYNKIKIELVNPPQASKIVFKIKDSTINNIKDIKTNLENLINTNYKFLEINQEIPFLDDILEVKEIEPYNICLVNNTDLNVEFDIIDTTPKKIYNNSENIVNENTEVNTSTLENNIPQVLSKEELRLKRLEYYNKRLKNK